MTEAAISGLWMDVHHPEITILHERQRAYDSHEV